MTQPASYDVFLSHNRQQKPWVRDLARFLRGLGVAVFFDEDSIEPGQDSMLAIERALEGSRAVVLVLSRAALRSKWVTLETALRLSQDPIGEEKVLIPIIAEPLSLAEIGRPALRRLDAVDLTDPERRESEFRQFLRALGIPDDRCQPLQSWPPPIGIEELRVADINSVVAAGWSGIDLLDRLIALDYEVFENLTPSHEGDAPQWAPVFMQHPETWRLLTTESKEVVGYWHFVPLFHDDYERAVTGTLLDSEITADRLRLFELPGWYDVYFVSVVLQARFRRPKAVSLLFHSLLDVLEGLANSNVFLGRVCANGYTDSGAAICKSVGMTEVGLHSERGRIFVGEMAAILKSYPFSMDSPAARLYREGRPSARTTSM